VNNNIPLVSVCIPTFNRADSLSRTVGLLQNCSYSNIEIIISDNASTDNTSIICDQIRQHDERIKYFRHEINQGPTKNFNFAKSVAIGEYFMWLGDDDVLDVDYIRICIDELESDSTLVLAAGISAFYNSSGIFTGYGNEVQPMSTLSFYRIFLYLWNVADNSIFYSVYRIKYLNDVYLPNCLAGDWAWVISALLKGRAKVLLNIHIHREYEDSTSSSFARIVSTIGAPAWNARYPWLAINMNIFRHIVKSPDFQAAISPVKRIAVAVAVFFLIGLKGALSHFRKIFSRVPALKWLYKAIFKLTKSASRPSS
jgi:glycosyltransferase involved in cell wall biosynthesis